jgi:hypothetical protein
MNVAARRRLGPAMSQGLCDLVGMFESDSATLGFRGAKTFETRPVFVT